MPASTACRDRGFYVPVTALSTPASIADNSVTDLAIPKTAHCQELPPPPSPLHKLLCRFELLLASKDPVPRRDQPERPAGRSYSTGFLKSKQRDQSARPRAPPCRTESR